MSQGMRVAVREAHGFDFPPIVGQIDLPVGAGMRIERDAVFSKGRRAFSSEKRARVGIGDEGDTGR